MRYRVLCVAVFILLAANLYTQELTAINARLNIGLPINDLGVVSQMPQLAPAIGSVGIGLDVEFNEYILFSPFLDIAVNEVIYSEARKVVYPRAFVDATSSQYSTLLLFYVGPPFIFRYPIGEFFRLGVGISPTLVFRAPLNGEHQQEIGEYYINEGRFFVPEGMLYFGYRFQDIELSLLARALIPISNAWDNDGSNFTHDMIFFITVNLRFELPDPASRSENLNVSANR